MAIFRMILLALAPALLTGQSGLPETGIPFVRNYAPRTYGADAQNWALAMDARGILFVGNNSGVLEYDGVRWRLIPTLKGGVVRSLAVGADGRVYVGAVGEFGVLVPDTTGQLAFTPLCQNLKTCPGFTDVWVTAAIPGGVLFQTREALFLYQGGRILERKAETTFHTSFVVDGRIFVRQREVGLEEWRGGSLALVPGGERFRKESIFAMLSLEGRGGPGGILVGSRNLGLFRLTEGGLEPFRTPAEAFLKDNTLYHGARLADGTLAFATLRGGLLLLSPEGKPLALLNHANGLLGDNVKQVLPGLSPSLWLALDTGIAQAEWPSAFSSFDERQGISGQVWDIAREEGRIYAATGQGLFVLQAAPGPLPFGAFRPVAGPTSQCTALLPMEGELLVACGQGVFAIRNGKALPLRRTSTSAICFLRSRVDPARVFVGCQGELAVLRKGPGATWREEGILSGISDDIYALEEEPDGTLWAGTGADRVLRIRLPQGWNGTPGARVQVDRFGPGEGLAGSGPLVVTSVQGALAVGTKQGIFQFDPKAGRFVPHPLSLALFPGGRRWIHTIREDARGRVWLTTSDETGAGETTGYAQFDGRGGVLWSPAPFQRLGASAIQVIKPEEDGVVWFGGAGGILRYDPALLPRDPDRPFGAVVRKLIRGRDTLVFGGEAASIQPPRIPFQGGALRFEFSAPSPFPEGGVQYQVRLLGLDREWSPWSIEAQKEFTGLYEGDYEFQVRAQDIQGGVSSPASYRFTILAPWYRRWWAFLALAALLGLALRTLLQVRTRRLRQRNAFLHGQITEATWELRAKERRLEAQTEDLERMNGELRALNQQKDEFLGIVVHDLRNPLNGMLLNAELLLEESDPREADKRIRNVLKAGEEMKGLISRFLDLAAIDAGGVRAQVETVSVEGALQDAWTHFQVAAQAKDIALERRLAPEAQGVLADPRFLKAVLDNLVSNALKFSQAGTRVTLGAEAAGGWVRFSVEDQGPGLTPEDRQRLFGRFARLSARPTAGESSVGLGLSIVKVLVEAMGGAIAVQSELGRGTVFQVELPVPEAGTPPPAR